MKIYRKKKRIKTLVYKFSFNHTIIYHATDLSLPRIDSSRVFANPLGLESVFAFHSPNLAHEYERHITKAREGYISQCCNIVIKAQVQNTIDDLKPSASMFISGMSTGKEIKLWVEKEFEFSEIHTDNYVLGIIVNEEFIVLKDEIPALLLYNHSENNSTLHSCDKKCFTEPKNTVPEEILLEIRLNRSISEISENDDLYSIEKRCGNNNLPKWLVRLLSELYNDGPGNKGVFRHCGRESILPKWYKFMLKYDDFVITEDIYNKASILKYFLRKIDGSLMTKNTKRQFNSICKEFVSPNMTATKYISIQKRKSKLLEIIRSIPRNNLYLLQNILLVIEVLLDYKNTMLTPLSLSKAMSPSIFPLIDLSLWEFAPKIFEAIILLTNELVGEFVRDKILKDFSSFTEKDPTPNQSDSISMVSNEDSNCKQIKLNSDEIMDDNDDISHVHQDPLNIEIDLSVSTNINSSLNLESLSNSPKLNKLTQFPMKEDTEQPSCSSPNKSNEMYQDNYNFESQEHLTGDCNDGYPNKSNESDLFKYQSEENECLPTNINYNISRSIIMGIKMKEICRNNRKPTDIDLSSDIDLKENIPTSTQRDKISLNQRHKSLIKPEISVKDLNRSASTAILSPRIPRLFDNDLINSATNTNEVTRRNSRKDLPEARESNVSMNRSRSPLNHVQNLIRVYENKCKGIGLEESTSITESSQKNSFYTNDLSNVK